MGKYPGIKLNIEHGNAGEFGQMYSGSKKQRQMKRKRNSLLDTQLKPNMFKHDRSTKYNKLRN